MTHCSTILAKILVKVRVPAVIKLAVKCAEVFFRLIDFDSISVENAEEHETSLLNKILETIGLKIANYGLDTKSIQTEEKMYYVCANLNMPKEEDFTFILTALWNWHYENPIHDLDLIRDASEIT